MASCAQLSAETSAPEQNCMLDDDDGVNDKGVVPKTFHMEIGSSQGLLYTPTLRLARGQHGRLATLLSSPGLAKLVAVMHHVPRYFMLVEARTKKCSIL